MDVDDGAVGYLSTLGTESSVSRRPLCTEPVENSSHTNLCVTVLALAGNQGDSPLLRVNPRDLVLPVLEDLGPSFGQVIGNLFDQFLVHATHRTAPLLSSPVRLSHIYKGIEILIGIQRSIEANP